MTDYMTDLHRHDGRRDGRDGGRRGRRDGRPGGISGGLPPPRTWRNVAVDAGKLHVMHVGSILYLFELPPDPQQPCGQGAETGSEAGPNRASWTPECSQTFHVNPAPQYPLQIGARSVAHDSR